MSRYITADSESNGRVHCKIPKEPYFQAEGLPPLPKRIPPNGLCRLKADIESESLWWELDTLPSVQEENTELIMKQADRANISFAALAKAELVDDGLILENPEAFVAWSENWTGSAGSIVSHEGLLYRSIHDVITTAQNTNPAQTPAMWTKIGDPREEFPEWYAPIGAHDAYQLGDRVTFSGQRWESTADNNVWQPGVYGWVVIED